MKTTIKGFSRYEIYDNGDVINTQRHKVLEGSIGEHGYRYYRLVDDNGKKEMRYAHRLVAEHFLPNENNLPVVNHKDGNKLNNSIENLEWVTYSENVSHAHDNGLIKARYKSEYYEGDLENEIWKQIFDLPYSISSKGRVRNDRTNLLLKPGMACGYYKVRLSVDGKARDYIIHNLLYDVFYGDRIDDKQHVIDHIDGNKLNNTVENLRQITLSENVRASYYQQKTNKSAKPVKQLDLNGNLIAEFPSARAAAGALKLDASTISKVCRKVNKTHGGFIFEYIDKE